jgi:ribosome-associated protein
MKIRIETEYIKLQALLKFAGLAGSGAEAKDRILNGHVAVNGESEIRRGRKVRPGDIVETDGATVEVE